jgi:hypothetical protein
MPDETGQPSIEKLEEAIPPRDGGANDPVAKAEDMLDDVDMDAQREALKNIQKNIPSSGS